MSDSAEPVAQERTASSLPVDDEARIDTAQLLQIGRGSETAADDESWKLSQSYAGIAAALAVVGLVGVLFVLWMVPFSIGAVVFADLARRQGDSHWPVKLGYLAGIAGILFGGIWLVYYLL